jgi:AcrR family transcriptional regulator
MPKPTRNEEQIEQVRESIVQGALDLIVEEGYENLTMVRLGSRLKMTGANLYNYFQNRDALIIAIHKKIFSLLHEKLSRAVQDLSTPLERVKSLVGAFVDFGVENANIYDIAFSRPRRHYSAYKGTPLEAKAYEEYLSSFEVLVLANRVMEDFLKTKGLVAPPETQFLVIKFLSELHGIISLYNSGLLPEIAADPAGTLQAVTQEITKRIADIKNPHL